MGAQKVLLSEKELVQQILSGSEEAKTLFYRTHVERLYPTCVHFLGYQDPEVDDVVQETFLIALKKLDGFEFRSSLSTWMNRICVNLCYKRLLKRRNTLAMLQEDLEQLTSEKASVSAEKEFEDEEKRFKLNLLERLLGNLSAKCRQIIELRDKTGKSYAEIGQKLKIPMGTVMSQLARCREALKQLAENEMESRPNG